MGIKKISLGFLICLFISTSGVRASEDWTYYRIPEWYVVFASQDYAKYLQAGGLPSKFPYQNYVQNYWQYYAVVWQQTKNFPIQPVAHIMLSVVGASFSAENYAKFDYETGWGRFFETLNHFNLTAEELFAAQVATDYANFMYVRPWYEFDFFTSLHQLWTEVPVFGDGQIRKVERRIVLTQEYATKGLYGALIRFLSEKVFEPDAPTIPVKLKHVPEEVLFPRYKKFTDQALDYARKNYDFVTIDGNNNIVLSITIPLTYDFDVREGIMILNSKAGRLFLKVEIRHLANFLRSLKPDEHLEMIYDF